VANWTISGSIPNDISPIAAWVTTTNRYAHATLFSFKRGLAVSRRAQRLRARRRGVLGPRDGDVVGARRQLFLGSAHGRLRDWGVSKKKLEAPNRERESGNESRSSSPFLIWAHSQRTEGKDDT
jgi:hypothetical protein